MIEIYELAKKAGACSFGLRSIDKANNVGDLIRLLKSSKGVEFIMENNFMTPELYNQYRTELEKENIHMDRSHAHLNPRLVIAIGGEINIEVNDFQVCEIYAKGTAVINLVAHDNAYVSIELYGQAKLISESYGQAKVKEYLK